MNKIDSMWYHEIPANGALASSHIPVIFCALAREGMIVQDLLEMDFEGIPSSPEDESVSPLEYCLVYTDGEIFDTYIKAKFRAKITALLGSDKIYDFIADKKAMYHDQNANKDYSLVCSWENVKIMGEWIRSQL